MDNKSITRAIVLLIVFCAGMSYPALAKVEADYGQIDAGTHSAHDLLQRGFPQTTKVEDKDSALPKQNYADTTQSEQKVKAGDQDRQSALSTNNDIADSAIKEESVAPDTVPNATAIASTPTPIQKRAFQQLAAACTRLRMDAKKINQLVDKRLAKVNVVSQTFASAKELLPQLDAKSRVSVVMPILRKVVKDLNTVTRAQAQLTRLSDEIAKQCKPALADLRLIRQQFAQLNPAQQQQLQANKKNALKEIDTANARDFRSTPPFDTWVGDFKAIEAKVTKFQQELANRLTK